MFDFEEFESIDTEEVIDEGTYYFLAVGKPFSPAYGDLPKIFKVYNKEFGVMIDETPSEMSARYYLQHHERVKAQYVSEGLGSLIGEPETPHG